MSFGGGGKHESFTFSSHSGVEIAGHSGLDWGFMRGYMPSSKIDELLYL